MTFPQAAPDGAPDGRQDGSGRLLVAAVMRVAHEQNGRERSNLPNLRRSLGTVPGLGIGIGRPPLET